VADNLEFRELDIAKDELPLGDCAILRQVLQHLSNAEISCGRKLYAYKYVLLTEHLYRKMILNPHKDIISGSGIRPKKNKVV
jgi:hypothetical protein